jgi:hypothetical protein
MALQIITRTLFISALIFFTRAACAQDIRIAVAASMTGPLAESGDEVKRGAELAARDINAAGKPGSPHRGGAALHARAAEEASGEFPVASKRATR